jgi:hypothetical protein
MPFWSERPMPLRRILALVGVFALFLSAGVAVAAYTVSSNPFSANGNYQVATNLNYWTETAVAELTNPGGTTTVSTAVGTPTRLSAGTTNYLLDTGATGDNSVVFNFTEQTNVTHNVEIELTFTVGTQTGSTVTVTAYVETQATVPTAPVAYSFYYDLGTTAGTSTVLISVADQTSQACSHVGTCP